MDLEDFILQLYGKGRSVGYITQCVYKKLNHGYFYDFYSGRKVDVSKYHKIDFCRNKVERTILEHISTTKDVVLY